MWRGTLRTTIRSGCVIFSLLLMPTNFALARPMHVLASTPAAEAIMHGSNVQYVVRFDGPVDHAQSRLEILRDGQVVKRLNPLLDSAADVLFASTAPQESPHLSDRSKNVGEERLLLQHLGEAMHQWAQPVITHGGQ